MTRGVRVTAYADPTRAERAARAALAASESAGSAAHAAASCREAAEVMRPTGASAAAAQLLADALDVLDRFDTDGGRTATLVDWAEALVGAGRLADARDAALAAVLAAEGDGDDEQAGRAALALSGIWANELRAADLRGRATGHQRRALARLGTEVTPLTVRLRARLAATEAFYEDEPPVALYEALGDARRTGDGRAIADCLSLLDHVLLGPEHGPERLALSDEMIKVTSEAGEPALAVVGLFWRTVNLYLAGDPRADRSLATLRSRDDAMPCLAITYQRRVLDVMTLVRAGRLEEAEREADACLALGGTVGDADALSYYGAHLLLIRWFQGRDGEVLELFTNLATAATLDEVDHTFEAAHAALAARCGRLDLATGLLDRLRRLDLRALPRRSTWMATMMGVIVAAAAVGDRELSAAAYDLLAPFGHLPVMPSFAVVDFGAADHFLGTAARCLGRPDEAVAHFERAIAANGRTGNLPLVCIGRVELAETLVGRGAPGDDAVAIGCYERALTDGAAIGLVELCRRWAERRDELAARVPAPHGPAVVLRRLAHGWALHRGDVEIAVPHLVGLQYIAELLAAPGREIPAVVLAGGPSAPLDRGDRQAVLDEPARHAYERRIESLAARIARARDLGNERELERAQDELDALVAALRAATHAGRARRFAGADERARTAVRKAIVRAVAAVEDLDPWAGAHLRSRISTGTTCVYRPEGPVDR